MNLATLIEICRPGDLKNYPKEDLPDGKIETNIVKEYELIEDSIRASGSSNYLDGLDAEYLIKNKTTGKYYQVITLHESWTESMLDSFKDVDIFEVKPVEKMVVFYEPANKKYLESL